MVQERRGKRKGDSPDSYPSEAVTGDLQDRGAPVWIREDGAICIGAECIVIKPRADSRDLDIEISPDRCGEAVADEFADVIYKTIGRGGATHFKVKSELEKE